MSTELNVVDTQTLTGVIPTYTTIDPTGSKFKNDGRIQARVKNASGVQVTVGVVSQAKCNQGTEHDLAVVIANGAEKIIGPFAQSRFNDPSGYVNMTWTGSLPSSIGVTAALEKTAADPVR